MRNSPLSSRVLVALAGLAFGVAAEWIGHPPFLTFDAAVGALLILAGYAAWTSIGPLVATTGFAWFLGTLWVAFAYVHRAPLALLVVFYPRSVPRTARDRLLVLGILVYVLVVSFWRNDALTIVFATGVVLAATTGYRRTGGRERRARTVAALCAIAFGGVLAADAAGRLAGAGDDRVQLFFYDAVVLAVGVALALESVLGPSARAAVTSLAVDLGGRTGPLPLRDRLARALDDPALVLAYRLVDESGYVDESGRAIELPGVRGGRAVTPIVQDGAQVAALIHDPVLLDEPELVAAVAALTGLALSNARLQAETLSRANEIERSRRRLIEAADEQRRRLERELRNGAVRKLDAVERMLPAVEGELRAEVAAAREELEAFAQGIHPAALTEHGVAVALAELGRRGPGHVTIDAPQHRFEQTVEATVYFVCSEALANIAKHADASEVTIVIRADDGLVRLEIEDDGVGGADPLRGSGLSGLADRVEGLGGRLSIESRPGSGTHLTAVFPV